MPEDMIERVAKRLWDHSFDRMPDPPWEQTTELQKRFNRMLAREAIDEMRVPSEAMREMVHGDKDALDTYRDLIDAALPASPKQPGAK